MVSAHYKVTIFNEDDCSFEFKVIDYGKNEAIKRALEKYNTSELKTIRVIKVEEDVPYKVIIKDLNTSKCLFSKDYYCESKAEASKLGINDFMNKVAFKFDLSLISINVE